MEEVKDSDPTDLAELPKKEKMKEKPEKKKKEKKEKKPKKHKVLKRVLLILFLLILLGGAGAYLYLNDFVAKITDGGNLLGFLFSDPDTPLKKDEQGRTNIIIFGTEGYNMDDPNYDGGFLTDSMMLLSIDQDSGDAKAVSLPRLRLASLVLVLARSMKYISVNIRKMTVPRGAAKNMRRVPRISSAKPLLKFSA